mmetsp:Transcript_10188/g.23856  ORF Transcript_10188/g.23856 Transcript_10188/m.23856 type:complete len:245 (-) Transcript_10188:158-892(-)
MTMLGVCTRSSSKDLEQARCILCGEKKCSGCQALFQKNYRQRKSERRQQKVIEESEKAQRESQQASQRSTDLTSTAELHATTKKDACFYSQASVFEDGEDLRAETTRPEREPRKASKTKRPQVYVWFQDPQKLPSDSVSLFAPSEYTVYEFVCQLGDRRWSVRKRFSEFVALDAALDETLPEAVALPPFPSKHLLARLSPDLVRQRRTDLQVYLRLVLADAEASAAPHLRRFCGIDGHDGTLQL